MNTLLHRPLNLRPGSPRLARYIAAGAAGTALYYGTLIVFVELLYVSVTAATCIAFVIVVATNYMVHRSWTFRTRTAHSRAVLPFIAMSIAGFGINSAVMTLSLAIRVNYLLAQAVAIGIVVAWNYHIMSRIFSQARFVC